MWADEKARLEATITRLLRENDDGDDAAKAFAQSHVK